MKVSEFLQQAKALIDTPDKWTRNAYGRGPGGFPLPPVHPDSVCYCTMGAVHVTEKVTGQPQTADKAQGYLDAYAKQHGCKGVFSFNDASQHADVMRMFDTCIVQAQTAELT